MSGSQSFMVCGSSLDTFEHQLPLAQQKILLKIKEKIMSSINLSLFYRSINPTTSG